MAELAGASATLLDYSDLEQSSGTQQQIGGSLAQQFLLEPLSSTGIIIVFGYSGPVIFGYVARSEEPANNITVFPATGTTTQFPKAP